jgi:adenylate kinase family enzyme
MPTMQRVSVVGSSGSGKSTLARELAAHLGVQVLELDSVFHQPGWEPLPEAAFQARVTAWMADHPDGWVVEGNYSAVRPLVWAEADTVVWFDLPRWQVMSRVIPRTLRRVATREELWNGNREPLANLYSLDMERNIVVWSWKRHHLLKARFTAAERDPAWDHLRFRRVRHEADRALLVAIGQVAGRRLADRRAAAPAVGSRAAP